MLRGLVLALSLFLASALGAQAQAVTLGPEEMRKAAYLALEHGQLARARAYTDALIARDPGDVAARVIASRAARDAGDFETAKRHARAAWDSADTETEQFAAAMVMAQALSSDGQRTRAQLWLRRARHIAPTPGHAAKAARDFRYVRLRNPWQTFLSFSVQPNSNINNGSSERSSTLNYRLTELFTPRGTEFELQGDALALSGVEYRFGAKTRYRLHETATRAQDLFFEVDLREYTLSSDAKALAPDAKASDFSFTSVAAGYGLRGINRDGKGEARGRLEFGQSWYGGDKLARYAELSAAQSFFLPDAQRLNLQLTAKKQFGQLVPDVDTVTGDISYSRPFGAGHRMIVGLSLGTADSDNTDYAYDSAAASVQVALAQPIMSAQIILGLSLSRRDYVTSRHSRDGRRDDKITADMTMIFKDIDYYGFNPTMTISAARTDSNIGLYSADLFGVSLGIRSAF